MSVAYIFVVNVDPPPSPSKLDGKALAHADAALDAAAVALGVAALSSFVAISAADMEEFDISADNGDGEWFSPAEGLATVASLLRAKAASHQLPEVDRLGVAVVEDLEHLEADLKRAEAHGLQWRLEIDF